MKAIITKAEFDALGDLLKAEYTAIEGDADGRYLANIDSVDGWVLENTAGLRSSLQRVRTERDGLKGKIAGFDGIESAEQALAAIAKLEEMKNWTPEQEVQAKIDAKVAELKSKFELDLTAAHGERDAATQGYHRHLLQASASSAISRGMDPKLVDVMLPHVVGGLKVFPSENGNPPQIWAVEADGSPRITQKAGQTGNMEASELVDIFSKDDRFKSVIPGTGATGSGASGAGGDRGTGGDATGIAAIKDPTARLAAIREADGN